MATIASHTTTFITPAPAPAAWRLSPQGPVRVRRCLVVRADSFMVRAELFMLALGAGGLGGAHLHLPASQVLGAALLLLASRGSFYVGGVHRLITAPSLN